jgi:serine/threonine-protein kinase HipA
MAIRLYGSVFYETIVAGTLEQVPDGRFAFTYDATYVIGGKPQIAYTLPRQVEPLYSFGLPPFFDNLVAEGWLARAQARALGIAGDDRFARLLAFGMDCPGAVSVIDPRPARAPDLTIGSGEEIAALANRASISGVQPKLYALRGDNGFRPARQGEPSTHIAKLPSPELYGMVELEFLTTRAAAALLPDDRIVSIEVAAVEQVQGPCLLVERFDRTADHVKIHFEEFNQLLGRPAEAKYEGSYGEMAAFISAHQVVQREQDVDRLFRRVLTCILLGNNDAHLKNFALLYTHDGFRLGPFYDIVASTLYPRYKNEGMALRLGDGANPRALSDLSPKHLLALTSSFGLSASALTVAVRDLRRRLPAAEAAIGSSPVGGAQWKEELTNLMRRRWNGTFDSIGKE